MEDAPNRSSRELWRHPQPENTQIYAFRQHLARKYGLPLKTYKELHQWSISNVAHFWEEILQWTGIRLQRNYTSTLDASAPMFPRPQFFPSSTLNFAENLLYPSSNPDPRSIAVVGATETTREYVSWASLREGVRRCSRAMQRQGIGQGDRVACYSGNHANTLIAMLSATALGAIWTGVSPDNGAGAVVDRLGQIEPVLLFSDNAVRYNMKVHKTHHNIVDIVAKLPSLKAVVVFNVIQSVPFDIHSISPHESCTAVTYDDFLATALPDDTMHFESLPPDHPVYILYSSGTTGAPKGIVHSSLGILLQHKKEHILHCDLTSTSRLFYYTTTTWMMFHWMVSALASGTTIVLYDGSPFQPQSQMSMPLLIDELRITHFGTSAKYLSMLEQSNVLPSQHDPCASLSSLQYIFSTGSPLAPSTFEYTYRAFGPNILLGSITGGTDILSLFGAPNPLLPVHAGEIQCIGLGMSVRCYDSSTGDDITDTGEAGELVCDVAFPCQPCMFWPPGPEGERKYRSSYFDTFDKIGTQTRNRVWWHGDFIRFDLTTGGMWMLGRSDGVLKPGGVRFGSSEIYNVMLKYFSEQVADSLCVGRRRETDKDETVVLFLQMAHGHRFTDELAKEVRRVIKTELSMRHVPGIIDQTPEIPVTANGKKIEGTVKQILCGTDIKTRSSVANPDCLAFYREWDRQHT